MLSLFVQNPNIWFFFLKMGNFFQKPSPKGGNKLAAAKLFERKLWVTKSKSGDGLSKPPKS